MPSGQKVDLNCIYEGFLEVPRILGIVGNHGILQISEEFHVFGWKSGNPYGFVSNSVDCLGSGCLLAKRLIWTGYMTGFWGYPGSLES